MPLGLAGNVSHGCCVRGGIGGEGSHGWRCAIAIGGEGVAWVALCHCDWLGRRSVGGAVPLRLVGKASRGWRYVIGVVWVALCHGDWGKVSRGGKASRGWRCTIEIDGEGVALALRGWRCAIGIGEEDVEWMARMALGLMLRYNGPKVSTFINLSFYIFLFLKDE